MVFEFMEKRLGVFFLGLSVATLILLPSTSGLGLPVTISIGTLNSGGALECEIASEPSFSTILMKDQVVGNAYVWETPSEGVFHWRLIQTSPRTAVKSPIASGSFVALDSQKPGVENMSQVTWQSTSVADRYNIKITESTGKTKTLLTSSSSILIPRQATPQIIEIIPVGKSEPAWSCCFEPNLALGAQKESLDQASTKPLLIESTTPSPALAEYSKEHLVAEKSDPVNPEGYALAKKPTEKSILPEVQPGIITSRSREDLNIPETETSPVITSSSPPVTPEIIKNPARENLDTAPGLADQTPTKQTDSSSTPAATTREKPSDASKVENTDKKKRLFLFHGFAAYDKENIRAQKLEVDLIDEKNAPGFGVGLFTNPVKGLVITSVWDYHEHEASTEQKSIFEDHKIRFSKARYTWDGGLGWNLLSFFDLSSHMFNIKFMGAMTQFPALPLEYSATPDTLPVFRKVQKTLTGGAAEYVFMKPGAKGFAFSGEAGYLTASKNSGFLAFHRLLLEYYPMNYWALTLGGFSRFLSVKECHSDEIVCLTEGKVHTTISEIGAYLGTGVVIQ